MHDSLDQEIRTLQSIFWSERDPDGLAFASLADAFRRKGEVREALDLLTDGMSRHPEFVTGHAIATRLYSDQGLDYEAELAARRVLELDPEHLVGLSALATLLAGKGEDDEADRLRSTLLELDPDSEEARVVALDGHPGDGAPSAAPEITEFVPETNFGDTEDTLFDDLTLVGPGEEPQVRQPGDEELAAAMDSLGLVGEDEMIQGSAPLDVALPGPEAEFTDLDALAPDDATDPGASAPDGPDETVVEVMDLGALAPDEPDEAELEVMDLSALAPDEPVEAEADVMDLSAVAPDEPDEAELEVMDLSALAPDEPDEAEAEVMDLSALASDEPDEAEPEVMDLSALAPDEPAEAEADVMDLSALAPDEPDEAEAEVMDLSALAPDEPDEAAPEVMDLSALAPDEPEPEVMDLSALAPDVQGEESVPGAIDLTALAPDEPPVEEKRPPLAGTVSRGSPEMNDTPAEPIYTRTLADLYTKQGFDDKALEVLKALQARNPSDTALTERIAILEAGGAPKVPVPDPQIPGDGHSEDEVEERARELAEHGLDGAEAVDTPFAWDSEGSDDGDPDEPAAGNYFDSLLAWENRAEP